MVNFSLNRALAGHFRQFLVYTIILLNTEYGQYALA
jgi:hypothetical protein